MAGAIARQRRGARLIFRTTVPRWFLDASATAPIEVHAVEVDTGVVQIDSLRVDEAETVRRAVDFARSLDARAEREAVFLREVGATVVVGDVPPLAFAAAARAGVPSVALANFTWDWIYDACAPFARHPAVIAGMREAYGLATSALRLPMHGGFEPMQAVVRDIPFIARRSALGRAAARRALGLSDSQRVVLPSFGAYGLALPYADLAVSPSFTLLLPPGSEAGLEAGRLRYEDLVAAADVVVSKPGYGIVSDCIANGAALLYAMRGGFVEEELLAAEMPRVLRCRPLSQEDLRAGRWDLAIEALMDQPPPPDRPDIDGADTAARHILDAAGCRT